MSTNKNATGSQDYRGTVVNLTRPQTLSPWGEVFELDLEGRGDIGCVEREGKLSPNGGRNTGKDGEVLRGESYVRDDKAPCYDYEECGWIDDWKPTKARGKSLYSYCVFMARISD